ncbi:MAG TPA: sugar phosphate isomerase/epimerase family protein [Planctomycetaceae bacterium]|jgi:hydroxypyruvate isomerase|nr:sugar phosphate isomerase/epimerase family protein [Planctomycetaceae bacterium]
MMNRRDFLQIGSTGALCAAAVGQSVLAASRPQRFDREYAPQLGMFHHHAGTDPIDQIRFLAAQGFRSIEDTGLRGKAPALQTQIGRELARRGMSLACFTGVADFGRPTFASGRRDLQRDVLRELRLAIDAAERVGGRVLSVVPGRCEPTMAPVDQRRNAIDLLQRCADICEPRGIRLLLEPVDHGPGRSQLFLRSAHQAAELCQAVKRPCCRVLIDVYQQAAAGQDVPQLLGDLSDVLGHVQLGDFPGRKEPGTGELDFHRLQATLDAIGYRGALGMEHGSAIAGLAGERAVIDAYLALDRPAQRCIA